MIAARCALAACALAALARPASAHPLDLGYLRIEVSGAEVSIALDLHAAAAARLLGLPGTASAAVIEARAGDLADATFRGAPIIMPGVASTVASGVASGTACRWTAATATLRDTTASLTGRAECPSPPRAIRWSFPFVRDARVSPVFQLLVRAQLAGDERVAIVDRLRPEVELTGPVLGLAAFVWTGIEHIGAAPSQWHGATGWKLPDGIDHILFLLALMLAGGPLLRIARVVTGFTLGHSITLALSALHVARPPPSLIEPLIALSIALVAGEALLGRTGGQRWTVAAGFGLIHGFGFATALDQLDLPTGKLVSALLGYNVGVELGQLAIVLAAAPLVLTVHRHPRLHPIARGLALVILVAGAYWFVQRLGVSLGS